MCGKLFCKGLQNCFKTATFYCIASLVACILCCSLVFIHYGVAGTLKQMFYYPKYTWSLFRYTILIWTTMFTADYMIYRRRDVLKLFSEVVQRSKECDSKTRIVYYSYFYAAIASLLYACCITLGIVSNRSMYSQRYPDSLDVFCVGCDVLDMSSSSQRVVVNICFVLYPIATLGTELLLLYFIGLITKVTRKLLQVENEATVLLSDRFVVDEDINAARRRYGAVQTLVFSLDDVVSKVLLAWYVRWFFSSCQLVNELMALSTMKEYKVSELCYLLAHLLRIVTQVIFLTSCSSGLTNEVKRGFLLARDLPCSCRQFDAYNALPQLLSQLSKPITGLTIGGSVAIDATSLFSFVGAVVTYTVVFIQMDPALSEVAKMNASFHW